MITKVVVVWGNLVSSQFFGFLKIFNFFIYFLSNVAWGFSPVERMVSED